MLHTSKSRKSKTYQEKNAAVIYLNNKGLDYSDSDFEFHKQNSVIDIACPRWDYSFQVTTVEGDTDKLYRSNFHQTSINMHDAFNKIIMEPIRKKFKKYRGGESVKNIILLIHTVHTPPFEWFDPNSSLRKTEFSELAKKSGFKEIFLVRMIDNKAILLYSR